jgi:hypothetical protein
MSGGINVLIAVTAIVIGMTAKQVLQQHYEMTELVVPNNPPPPVKIKQPPPQELPPPPEPPKVELQPRQIEMPKPKPEPKPIQMEAKVTLPAVQPKPQTVILAPQPKAALAAAMPAQNTTVKPSTAPVHLGQTYGVTPNPNATRPANVAAIGNPYGGMNGPAVAPHGVVGSTGLGNGTKYGSSAGTPGRVASAGIPGATGTGNTSNYGKVATAGIPGMTQATAAEDGRRGSSFDGGGSSFQAAGAVHKRSAAVARPRRCRPGRDISRHRTSGCARRDSGLGPRA